MFINALLLLFLLAAIIQLCYYVTAGNDSVSNFPAPYPPARPVSKPPVSVIICARDEAANLRANLPLIMAQRYSNEAGKALFEVIVVNDCSTDDTEAVLQALEQQYDNLWHVTISPGEERLFPGKKFALAEGVKHAGNPILVMTDADCAPVSEQWLQYIVQPMAEGAEIVSGYGKYRAEPGILNAFTRWETLHSFFLYNTTRTPYMAVGRNMACTREIFLKAQATEVWKALPSGDDDLLVNTMATRDNYATVWHPDSFTLTASKPTWKEWMKQKQRHLSTGKYYRKRVQRWLGIYAFSHMAMWVLFFGLLFLGVSLKALLILMVVRLLFWYKWAIAAARLGERMLIPFFPLFDIGWMMYNFVFSPYIFLKNKRQWK